MNIGDELHAAMIEYVGEHQGTKPKVIRLHISRKPEVWKAAGEDRGMVWFVRPFVRPVMGEELVVFLGVPIMFSEGCPVEGVHHAMRE